MDGLHIWPRNSHMLMALANLDGSMTGTLYMDSTGGRQAWHVLCTRGRYYEKCFHGNATVTLYS
jgi:hypothetical protein